MTLEDHPPPTTLHLVPGDHEAQITKPITASPDAPWATLPSGAFASHNTHLACTHEQRQSGIGAQTTLLDVRLAHSEPAAQTLTSTSKTQSTSSRVFNTRFSAGLRADYRAPPPRKRFVVRPLGRRSKSNWEHSYLTVWCGHILYVFGIAGGNNCRFKGKRCSNNKRIHGVLRGQFAAV